MKMAAEADPVLMDAIKPEYDRVTKVHKKIKDGGLDLPDMAALPEPLQSTTNGSSFVNDVAPIIMQRCGRCHVNQSRGEFSARSFDSLMASTHVSPGRPDTSLLIEVIADGSMPPNGAPVPANELEKLKLWIRLGAKFDGQDPSGNLAENANNRRAGRRVPLSPEAFKTDWKRDRFIRPGRRTDLDAKLQRLSYRRPPKSWQPEHGKFCPECYAEATAVPRSPPEIQWKV